MANNSSQLSMFLRGSVMEFISEVISLNLRSEVPSVLVSVSMPSVGPPGVREYEN